MKNQIIFEGMNKGQKTSVLEHLACADFGFLAQDPENKGNMIYPEFHIQKEERTRLYYLTLVGETDKLVLDNYKGRQDTLDLTIIYPQESFKASLVCLKDEEFPTLIVNPELKDSVTYSFRMNVPKARFYNLDGENLFKKKKSNVEPFINPQI
ncbi:MAG: hypothetical protein WC867_04050 [Candidatus Pacearchaeota archaeon]|jgi:hypothetical protein